MGFISALPHPTQNLQKRFRPRVMILEEKQSITLADNALLESEHDFLEDHTIFWRRGKVQNYSQFLHCAPKK